MNVEGFVSIETNYQVQASETLFHSSMDWMLPVIEKIEATINHREERYLQVYINGHSCSILKGDLHLANGYGSNMTQGAYTACLKYIKEYS